MNVKKSFFAATGLLSVVLGTAGIFLPLLPTTPFLLLAGYLFARSSPRLHDWLLNHRHLGPYIHAFRNKTGLTKAQKLRIGTSMAVVMSVSIYFSPIPAIRWMLGGIWVFWTAMLFRTKTLKTLESSTPQTRPLCS